MTDSKKFLSHSTLLFVGTLVSGFFSYLFNTMMGRRLGPSLYGEMIALLSLVAILSVIGSAVQIVSTRYTSDYYHLQNHLQLKALFTRFTKWVVGFGIGLCFVGLILIHPLSIWLKSDHPEAILIALLGMLLILMISVTRGILQGAQRFFSLSINGMLEMILRFSFGMVLVTLGFSLSGALIGIALATLVSYLVSLKMVWQFILPSTDKGAIHKTAMTDSAEMSDQVSTYFIPVFIVSALLAVLLNIDILLVKAFFSSADAGRYAAVSTVAKLILYLSAPIISVMFPMISEKKTKGEKHFWALLMALILTVVCCLGVLAIFSIIPGTIIRVLYGSAYVNYFYLLPVAGLYVVFYSLINLMVNYFLAIKDYLFIWILIVVVVAILLACTMYHPTIVAVVRLLVAGGSTAFAGMFAYYLYTKRTQLQLLIHRTISDGESS
jgi:O-antigen/teichoic acid export membrane protein